jgi:hypothetical protein
MSDRSGLPGHDDLFERTMPLSRTLVVRLRSVSVVLLSGLGAIGCQVLLGDFEIDDSGIGPGGLGTACAPNSFRCREASLERCRADRRGFELFETCASAALCDPTAGSCRPCVANEFACSDGELRSCAGEGGFTNPVACDTPALCRIESNRAGRCAPPLCDAGSFSCDSGWLLACAKTRDRWDLVEYCGTDGSCDAAIATEAVLAGKRPHCASVACPAGGCAPPACTPGATRCSADLPAVELCSTNGQWIVREACASRELCDAEAGRCLPQACILGDTRCVGQTRQICAQDLTRFEDLERCPDAGTCAPSGCEPAKCTEGTTRCNGVAVETCIAGKFVATNRCATRALCSPTGCVEPKCDPAVSMCSADGRILTTCPPTRDVPRVVTCPEATVCNVPAGRCL